MEFLKSTFVSKPSFMVCRPYSWTNRRQMISVEAGPFATKDQADAALEGLSLPKGSRPGFIIILRPVPELSDATDDRGEALPYLSASWSLRAPRRLRIESIHFPALYKAENWADYYSGLDEAKGREVYTIEVLSANPRCLYPN